MQKNFNFFHLGFKCYADCLNECAKRALNMIVCRQRRVNVVVSESYRSKCVADELGCYRCDVVCVAEAKYELPVRRKLFLNLSVVRRK